ncbi:MAG: cytochrome c-type biogenesis CcmF C-terminal domain-containing protein, partial [Pseudomonadota bacterium]|nr:cytochrome c-type biogenesis CcmF C-terminal domain-containing protein [Pseudomonadota bacterium]
AAVGVPLMLFALRGPQLASRGDFDVLSRESGLILNNFLLTAAAVVVLIGTFYPLALEMVSGARITVGPPYFDATFNPIMGALVAAMAFGPVMAWRRGTLPSTRLVAIAAAVGALLVAAGVGIAAGGIGVAGLAGLALLGWLALGITADISHRLKPLKDGLSHRATALPAPVWGMWTAHAGMVVFLIGALGSGLFQTEVVVRATPGQAIDVAGKTMIFRGVEKRQGPNYVTETAILELRDGTDILAFMTPEKRFYNAERQTTTEAAIRPRLSGDDYAVLGDGDATAGYTLRLYRKPFVSWIWGGAVLMAIGGGIAAFSRRQRKAVTLPSGATGAPAE